MSVVTEERRSQQTLFLALGLGLIFASHCFEVETPQTAGGQQLVKEFLTGKFSGSIQGRFARMDKLERSSVASKLGDAVINNLLGGSLTEERVTTIIWSLGWIKAPNLLDHVGSILSSQNTGQASRDMIILYIGQLQSYRHTSMLVSILEGGSQDEVLSASTACVYMSLKACIGPILTFLQSKPDWATEAILKGRIQMITNGQKYY